MILETERIVEYKMGLKLHIVDICAQLENVCNQKVLQLVESVTAYILAKT